jgi:fumarate reductase subunit D
VRRAFWLFLGDAVAMLFMAIVLVLFAIYVPLGWLVRKLRGE